MDNNTQKYILPFIIIVLAILAFLVIRPIVVPVVFGLIFAYILDPVYKKLKLKIKSKYFCATIILLATLLILILPFIALIPSTSKEVLTVYTSVTNFEIYPILEKVAPSMLENPQLATEVQAAASHIKSALSKFILTLLQNMILGIPAIIFGIIIFLFTFFFSLIESDKFNDYFSVFFPLSKKHQDKFHKKFDQVTNSILYGELIVGIAQGIIGGIAFYILGVPNALLLTILVALAGVIPVIGPWFVWIPADILLFINGQTGTALSLLIFGLFVLNWVDTFLRPQIVSSKAEMNPAIALIGTIGGTYAFGVLGLLLGPLILAYLILLIEIYKDKDVDESIVLREDKPLETP